MEKPKDRSQNEEEWFTPQKYQRSPNNLDSFAAEQTNTEFHGKWFSLMTSSEQAAVESSPLGNLISKLFHFRLNKKTATLNSNARKHENSSLERTLLKQSECCAISTLKATERKKVESLSSERFSRFTGFPSSNKRRLFDIEFRLEPLLSKCKKKISENSGVDDWKANRKVWKIS